MNKARISLLALMALGALASALPAAAQAEGPSWYIGGEMVGEEIGMGEDALILGVGQPTFKVLTLTVGPCLSFSANEVWNTGFVASGVRKNSPYVKGCETSIANCKIEEIVPKNTPWKFAGEPATGAILIEGMTLELKPEENMACENGGLGAPFTFKGTLSGSYNNEFGVECIEYENSGSLSLGGLPVKVSGDDCLVDPIGEEAVNIE